MSKIRLDVLLVQRSLVDTREKAKRVVMAGLVFTEQERLDKPGMKVGRTIPLRIKGKLSPYVGRGGLKLKKAFTHFSVSAKNKIMLDVGSSTGGFTDCALQQGAKLSYAVDVGYNQLDWKLRSDPRVIVMERTNFRYVTEDMLTSGTPNLATVDVSFISLRLILPVLSRLLASNSDVIILIKPQFEAGRARIGKKGIVSNKQTHNDVLSEIITLSKNEQYTIHGLTYSPITGGEGNIEFLAHLGWQKNASCINITNEEIVELVDVSHSKLKSDN